MSQTGIIYEIVCNQTGERYVGSTTRNFKARISGHKGKANKCMSKPIIDRGDYVCNILETVMVDTKDELRIVERKWFENLDCVNKNKPYFHNDEDKEARREYFREYQKKRYQENPEKARAYKRTLIYKSLNQVTPEEFIELGDYLAEFKKVEKIMRAWSPELQNKLIQSLDLNANI